MAFIELSAVRQKLPLKWPPALSSRVGGFARGGAEDAKNAFCDSSPEARDSTHVCAKSTWRRRQRQHLFGRRRPFSRLLTELVRTESESVVDLATLPSAGWLAGSQTDSREKSSRLTDTHTNPKSKNTNTRRHEMTVGHSYINRARASTRSENDGSNSGSRSSSSSRSVAEDGSHRHRNKPRFCRMRKLKQKKERSVPACKQEQAETPRSRVTMTDDIW